MGSQIMNLLLQLCLLAVVCNQASATTVETTITTGTTMGPTTGITTTVVTTTTPFVCPIEIRKCKVTAKCGIGEGRCNKHSKCRGRLICGYQNCQQYHPCARSSDRCCEDPDICNADFSDRACCTVDNPCGLGGGNCDADAHCQGDLVCGQRNCNQFHPKPRRWANCCTNP